MVMAVIRMGRRQFCPARTMASRLETPCFRYDGEGVDEGFEEGGYDHVDEDGGKQLGEVGLFLFL